MIKPLEVENEFLDEDTKTNRRAIQMLIEEHNALIKLASMSMGHGPCAAASGIACDLLNTEKDPNV